ncbi:MEKHLA domain-containing protein [Sphingomonas sp. PB2P12]|uniref:MEKHLA domain-containing protein n=1 Tax=Sphingomonas sandaracina TaxID=3096157 RepID=UPI002FC7FC4E
MPSAQSANELYNDKPFFELLVNSYQRIVGKPLVPDNRDEQWLYESAPFAVVAHNSNPDPIFIYANIAAQRCFGYDWKEITSLPSRLSAEPINRADRQILLDRVKKHGHYSGYCGIRIAKSGHRFSIDDGCVWQLIDQDGSMQGQAAIFSIPG